MFILYEQIGFFELLTVLHFFVAAFRTARFVVLDVKE